MAKSIPVKKLVIGGLLYTLLFAGASETITGSDNDEKCGGKELWNLKVLTDEGASDIQGKSVTTIADLNKIDTDSEKRSKNKRLGFEKQIVTLKNVLIRKVLREDDNDYHLVLQDRKGNHMIAEIVDPECPDAQQSDYIDEYAQARESMDKYANNFQHYEFNITGVPFRDRAHGQTGKAENNLEIHPVLKLTAVQKLNF